MQAETFPSQTGKSDAFVRFAHKGARLCTIMKPRPSATSIQTFNVNFHGRQTIPAVTFLPKTGKYYGFEAHAAHTIMKPKTLQSSETSNLTFMRIFMALQQL